jgi:hypothetical protein
MDGEGHACGLVEDEAVGFIVLLTIVDENVGWRSMVMLGNWMV